MKILILCDLHNEFGKIELEQTNCDAVVLAGDTDIGIRGAEWAKNAFRSIPIIYISGNHEYYGKKFFKINRQLTDISENSNFYFLERDELTLDNVRFLGCTLWTDFRLYGEEKIELATYEAQSQITDYKRIRLGPNQGYRKLKPIDTIHFHNQSVQFLQEKLGEPFGGITIVVTHHSPTPKSISEHFEDDILNASFCSNLEWMIIKYKPNLWIHGHIHDKFDYWIGDTRIICNPRGYVPDVVEGFQEDLILEV